MGNTKVVAVAVTWGPSHLHTTFSFLFVPFFSFPVSSIFFLLLLSPPLTLFYFFLFFPSSGAAQSLSGVRGLPAGQNKFSCTATLLRGVALAWGGGEEGRRGQRRVCLRAKICEATLPCFPPFSIPTGKKPRGPRTQENPPNSREALLIPTTNVPGRTYLSLIKMGAPAAEVRTAKVQYVYTYILCMYIHLYP